MTADEYALDSYACDHDSDCIGAHCTRCDAELCGQCRGCDCPNSPHTCRSPR